MPDKADTAPLRPDLCVIGGGTAGHAVALAAGALGLTCVVVDERERLGRGQAANLAWDMLVAAAHRDGEGADWTALRARIGHAVAAAAPNHDAARLRALGATVLHGGARFLDARSLAVGHTIVRARRFVIAAGSRPRMPDFAPTSSARVLTPDTVASLSVLPVRLAVLGQTATAFEAAQAFRRLGAAVTLVGGASVDSAVDPELLAVVETALRRDGVVSRLDRAVTRVDPHGEGLDIALADSGTAPLSVTHLLVADGTLPRLDGLDLAVAGIRVRGDRPQVDAALRTTNSRVYAIGDVLGAMTPNAAAIAVQVGVVLRSAFFRLPARYDPALVPRTLRAQPAVAMIGCDEAEARRRGAPFRVLRAPLSDNARAVAEGDPSGHIKVIAAPNGRVLGAGIVGAVAEELIAPWGLAIAHGLSLDAMASLPAPAPSRSEASRQAALAFVIPRLRRPWIKRTLDVLRRLG